MRDPYNSYLARNALPLPASMPPVARVRESAFEPTLVARVFWASRKGFLFLRNFIVFLASVFAASFTVIAGIFPAPSALKVSAQCHIIMVVEAPRLLLLCAVSSQAAASWRSPKIRDASVPGGDAFIKHSIVLMTPCPVRRKTAHLASIKS